MNSELKVLGAYPRAVSRVATVVASTELIPTRANELIHSPVAELYLKSWPLDGDVIVTSLRSLNELIEPPYVWVLYA